MTRTATIAGRPGGHAAVLARTALVRAAALAAVCAGCALGFLAAGPAHLFSGGAGALEPAVTGLGAVAAGLGCRSELTRHAKAAVGRRSERRVAARLERLGATAVIHGAMLGAGGDTDHIVLGPLLAVVETKTGSGQVHASEGKLHAGRRTILGDPVAQVRRQAAALGRLCGQQPFPVVCIPDMTNRPFETSGVVVCSEADLASVLRAAPAVLAPLRAAELAARLSTPDLATGRRPAGAAARGVQGRRPLNGAA